MQFGFFDDGRREYVIETPATPLPWINYLGSQEFFSLISNTAGGYCFYRDAKLQRLLRYRYHSVPADEGGRFCYIKEKGKPAWNPGFLPTRTPLDRYECRHGMGYTTTPGSSAARRYWAAGTRHSTSISASAPPTWKRTARYTRRSPMSTPRR